MLPPQTATLLHLIKFFFSSPGCLIFLLLFLFVVVAVVEKNHLQLASFFFFFRLQTLCVVFTSFSYYTQLNENNQWKNKEYFSTLNTT